MSFVAGLRARAAAAHRRIVFPESGDERTLAAVRTLAAEGIVEPLLVLDAAADGAAHATERAMERAMERARASGVPSIDPRSDPRRDRVAQLLWERRGEKGLTLDEALALAGEPLFFADGLVALGEVDGCVAGAVHTTAQVLRAALWTVDRAPGVSTVSSAFYMAVSGFRDGARAGGEEVLTFADCAVVPNPTAAQLADIAIATATDRRRVVGDEPRVAFLSYGTLGSGAGPSVDRVRSAVEIVRGRGVDFAVDGELQGDAALMPTVGHRKAAGSPVAGRANVLIFPSLDAGNIAYKLVERIARATAIGPIVQGLARPCSDLSRGAVADDIINVAAVTALQATGAATVDVGGSRREIDQ